MDLAQFWFQGAGGPGPGPDPHQHGNSLRFRGAQYLRRTHTGIPDFPAEGTISFWAKVDGENDDTRYIYNVFAATNYFSVLQLQVASSIRKFYATTVAPSAHNYTGNPAIRDPSAWYHFCYNYRSNGVCELFINGVSDGTRNEHNIAYYWGNQNATSTATIGGRNDNNAGLFYKGYLAEFHSCNGTCYPPTTFGEFNADGVWVPREVEGVNYGQNGWYLDFSDPDDIGADRSGNGNNWVWEGFELTNIASHAYDWMVDSPTNNYTTINPLTNISGLSGTIGDLQHANLYMNSNGNTTLPMTISADAGVGNYYWEINMVTVQASSNFVFGVQPSDNNRADWTSWSDIRSDSVLVNTGGGGGNATWIYGNTTSSTPWTVSTGDVVGVHVDVVSGDITYYKNGVLQVTLDGAVDVTRPHYPAVSGYHSTDSVGMNFGQRPFLYPPGTTTATGAFTTLVYTGVNNGSTAAQPKTGLGFSPDLVWIKNRDSATYNHMLFDSIRNVRRSLTSNNTAKEIYESSAGYLSSFDDDGFSLSKGSQAGAAGSQNCDALGVNYVAWCWNAGDGDPVVNNDGSIEATVKASPENGFSVVTYTGTNNTESIGHGLGRTPTMVVVKDRTAGTHSWYTYHQVLGSPNYIFLNLTNGSTSGADVWGPPDDTTFTVGTSNAANQDGIDYVAYCFADVENRVETGSYAGNSGTNGVALGFKPAMVMIKNIDAGSQWIMVDTARGDNRVLNCNRPINEQESASINVFLRNNGFTLSGNGTDTNASGNRYIYIAFAENFTGTANPLSTANLEDVAITNPGEHFTTILDTGANILTNAETTFSNGLWWIKDRANSNQHQLLDSVRGGDLKFDCPTTAVEGNYAAPTGNSVAWCWSAPEAWTDTSVDMTASGRRNLEAGFSIGRWSGTRDTRDIPHGLNQAPEFIIVRARNNAQSFQCWHQALGLNRVIYLDETQRDQSTSSEFIAVDNSMFRVGNSEGSNSSGTDNMMFYAWHSVPGYSSFGTYQGNNNSDGTFIYTGFRPAWFMLKAYTDSGEWLIIDSARNIYNPTSHVLEAQDQTGEAGAENAPMDFVSNGVKLRGTGYFNTSGRSFIWAAFAEHPMGGGNVSPSPAR